MVAIELTAAGGLTDVSPVGGLVAGAAEAIRLHESLQQHRAITVALLPVVGQLAGDVAEDFRSHALRLHPGQDQKARVVDDQMHSQAPLLGAPADELITGLSFPGGGAKAQQRDKAAIDGNEVAQLRPRERCVAQVMIALYSFQRRESRAW